MVREIPLSRGKVALVSDADYERAAQYKWSAVDKDGKSWYARRVITQDGKQFNVFLHRFIMGVPDGIKIDHKDRDGLNCQRDNLRIATATQNSYNTGPRNATGLKGVFKTANNRYASSIMRNSVQVHLGTYDTAEEAGAMYDAAAVKIQGEFAYTNFDTIDPICDRRARAIFAGDPLALPRPERGPNQRLTDDDVIWARLQYAIGNFTTVQLAKHFGVTQGCISHALNGRTFRHITNPAPLTHDKRTIRREVA